MIREAAERDADAIVALWTEAYFAEGEGGRDTPYERAEFEATAAAAAHLLVAERDGEASASSPCSPPGSPPARSPPRARPNWRGSSSAPAPAAAASAAPWPSAAPSWPGRRAGRRSRSGAVRYQAAGHRLYESLGYDRVPERDSVDETGHGRLVFRLSASCVEGL